jgi:putative intracellular protease/amidase
MRRRILIPIPDRDFDTTEVAVPWRILTRAGHDVVFATENGNVGACDPLLLTGVIFGQLGAEEEPKQFYAALEKDASFTHPLAWKELNPSDFDALLLAGGHAPGMKQYLGSEVLREKVVAFAGLGKPMGAICHGPVVLARAIDPDTKRSVIYGKKTTCLPKYMERSAYMISAWKVGSYYRTYPAYVEDEVKSVLEDPARDFILGPRTLMARGTDIDDSPAFVVEDGSYVSARWPGDSYLFAKTFLRMIER